MMRRCLPLFLFLLPAMAQTHRMEIVLERLGSSGWQSVDPALILAQGDRIRFRFHTNFDGYLYVMNHSSSGKFEQLFPRAETGEDNHIVSGKDYQVPATSTVFRIAGPPGHEVVYWLVSPVPLTGAERPGPLPSHPEAPITLIPRCDDTVLKTRGDCVDSSAGPKLIPRGEEIPQNLSGAADPADRDLLFLREQNKAVISSPQPLTGPVVYEFRVAHK